MEHLQAILAAREERSRRIEQLFSSGLSSIVTATMNIPGQEKTSMLINRAFDLALQDLFIEFGSDQLFLLQKDSCKAGPYAIFLIKDTIQPLQMKIELVTFETTHPIGRWLDFDVYPQKGSLLGRKNLNLPQRRCFLCDEEATICRRTATHSVQELYSYTEKNLRAYVKYSGIHRSISL